MNLHKITLRETQKFFVLIGTDKALQRQHVIKILKKRDIQCKEYELGQIIKEDLRTYDQETFKTDFLEPLIAKYNPITTPVARAYGVLGFVRFLKGYYIILITEKKKVGKIGQHSIYEVKDTQMIPLFRSTTHANREDEAKYLQLFKSIEMASGFYFSYTYDLTRSLQENMVRKIRNKMAKHEPILEQISDIYKKDIYAEAASNPTSRLTEHYFPKEFSREEIMAF